MELDLQEKTRRDDVYNDINQIIDQLNNLSVFPSLVWVWAWDNVKYKLDYYRAESGEDWILDPKMTEKDVWDLFWDQADKNGFTLEYGVESLDEHVFDWMIDNDILIENTEEFDEDDEDGVDLDAEEE